MTLQYLDTLIGFATVMLGVSLVITILTQMISGVLGLRGTNLRWGIQTLFQSASLDASSARALSFEVLNHRLISDSTFSKFTSFFRRWRLATAMRKEELIDVIQRLKADPNNANLLNRTEAAIRGVIETWFDSIMDRVGQRFAMSMRYWTVGFALALAFLLHLDAIALLKKVSRDPAVRASLVASANAVMREAENVLGAEGATNIFLLSLEQLRGLQPGSTQSLTNAPRFHAREAAMLWLRTQLTNNSNAEMLLGLYGQLISSNTIVRAPEVMGSIAVIQTELGQAGLDVVPDYTRVRVSDYSPLHLSFWGMLVSAGLLSLGAPFWYNGLKTLMSLRPVLAARVHRERDGELPPNA